jgi:16S rRNA (uracil1498-N3)-methyltransferase
MRRFFVNNELKAPSRLMLSREETKHAAKVLRLEPGEELLLLNGKGLEAKGRLLAIGAEGAEVEVLEVREIKKAVRLELLQAPLKGPKMDWLVEKLTELGVDSLWPARTERTVASGDKEDRWQRIAQAAMKQSGNAAMPEIHGVALLSDMLLQLPDGARILLQPGATLSLAAAVQNAKSAGSTRVILAIGPEGGFTDKEESQFIAAGFQPASLSKQVLRGETAAIAALSIAAHCIDF